MSNKFHAIVYSILGICAAAAIIWGVTRSAGASDMETRLTSVYDSSLMSAMDALKDAQYKLEKSLISEAGQPQARLLAAVSADAQTVSANLSTLPLSHSAIRDTIKFSNQLWDFSASLIRPVDTPLSAEELKTIETMAETCSALYASLYVAQQTGAHQADAKSVYYAETDAKTRPIEKVSGESGIDYPSLIYDGPFSDARDTGTPKALSSRVISFEEAENIAREFVGAERVTGVSAGTDARGVIPAFGVTVRAGDVTLEVAVTKTGGQVLWMSPDSANFGTDKSIEECREAALAFLSSRNYPNMKPTYFQIYDGLAVVNFAATQGSCILYPDLIKVQVRMDTAQVVGFESSHYLMNHTTRFGLTPALNAEEAAGAVSSLLTLDTTQLCIIPSDAGETLCWEFKGTYLEHTYLVYIDAKTGEQADILKLVEDATGLLTT